MLIESMSTLNKHRITLLRLDRKLKRQLYTRKNLGK
ncbi:unnamed protein product [Schistosoma mattheei]|uniref:Uncharacterized protein n=1 Tax=Schistosoma mattheei TaxID=31246 RepID=A0A3P8F7I5_9TREM|nr:unnamed protein product [Schistosoma mattheei]